jgi:spermidine synthase
LAAYGRPGDQYRIYEINPLVVELARSHFHYLHDSAADIQVVLGDARLAMEAEPDQSFDTLVLDAFSGDSVPIHLLTHEAFQGYLRHLKHDGVIAVHVSSRYIDLAPVVAAAAATVDRASLRVLSMAKSEEGISAAEWILVSRNTDYLAALVQKHGGQPLRADSARLWTDQFSNILDALR